MENRKICLNCNQQVEGGVNFCPNCGSTEFIAADVQGNPVQNQENGAYQTYAAAQQPNGYAAQGAQGYPPNGAAPTQKAKRPMKWLIFLNYFGLFFSALYTVFNGLIIITGNTYGVNSEKILIYALYPSLQTVDCVFGILNFAFAGFQIFTRFQLAGFKARGPKCLYACYGISLGLYLLYIIAASSASAQNLQVNVSSITSALLGFVIMLLSNMTYFKKRKDLFVN